MADTDKALKSQNLMKIWGLALLDAALLLAIVYPHDLNPAQLPFAAIGRLLAAAVAPALVLLVTSILSPDIKAVLVFWRLHEVLPGHRAFSKYAPADTRIDLDRLRQNVGEFPDDPRDQNSNWYRLYKKVAGESAVALAHKNYLLFRDMAAMSVLLAVVVPVTLLICLPNKALAGYSLALFSIQFLATAVAARNSGVRFVTNVLAEHAAKKRR